MTDYFDDEIVVDVADGRFARITHASDSPPTVYFEYLDGTSGHATSDSAIPFEKGAVVFNLRFLHTLSAARDVEAGPASRCRSPQTRRHHDRGHRRTVDECPNG